MKKHQRERDAAREEFNRILPSEYDQIRKGMDKYVQQRINGRLQSRFIQYMVELNVLRFDERGNPVVMNPYEYTKWNRANYNIERRDEEEQKAFYRENPEEARKDQARMARWFGETREMIKLVNKNTNQQTVENK